MQFCYSCGHPDESHRKLWTTTGRVRYVDCIQPVRQRMTTLKIHWVDVCQCSEFTTKEKVKVLINE